MSVNKVILIGRLGKDPELRYTTQQFPICNFSIATSERRKDQSGNWGESTEWHNIVTLGKTAENCSKYLKKGREVFIEGKLRTRKWQDKEGKDRYTTEVTADVVQFLGGKGEGAGSGVEVERSDFGRGAENDFLSSLPTADSLESSPKGKEVSFDDDDIPF